MDLATFERRAFAIWEQIPARFREGVTAFVVEPGVYRKERFEDGWCYGTCEPDPVMALIPDAPVSSVIRVWFGSFVHIASEDDDFDWEEELRETIRHELQHHLEWRSGVDHLGREDDLEDLNDLRLQGEAVPPHFYRWGTPMGRGAWLAADELFVEVPVRDADWGSLARSAWTGRFDELSLRVGPLPEDLLDGDVITADAELAALDDAELPWAAVNVVFLRKRPWWHLAAWWRSG